jgi:hypothetical protein
MEVITMDRLTIFRTDTSTTTVLEEEVTANLNNMLRELQLLRKGQEAFVYGEETEDSDDVDMEEVVDKED